MHLGGVEGHVADVDGSAILGREVGIATRGLGDITLALALELALLLKLALLALLLGGARGLREVPGQGHGRGGLRRDVGADGKGGDLLAGDGDGPHGTGRGPESGTTDRIPGWRGGRLLVFISFYIFLSFLLFDSSSSSSFPIFARK